MVRSGSSYEKFASINEYVNWIIYIIIIKFISITSIPLIVLGELQKYDSVYLILVKRAMCGIEIDGLE